jgi:hypothetical protein
MKRYKKFYLSLILTLFFTGTGFAQQFLIKGDIDCGSWVNARKNKTAVNYEGNLIGLLNGMSAGSGVSFWDAKGNALTFEQVNLWMDNYCLKNPLSTTFKGADELMNEHTGGQFRKSWQKLFK